MTTTRQTDDDPFDERGVLRDGRTAITSVMLRDSADNSWRKEMDRRFHDGHGGSVGHRPGFVVGRSVNNDARERAYATYDAEIGRAWANAPVGAGDRGQRGAQEGDQCTIDGAPGHMRMVPNVGLQCVADRSTDRADGRVVDARQQAYLDYDKSVSEAWRTRASR